MPLTVRSLDSPFPALGIAAHFLARREPFASFKFGDLVSTLDTQIRRKHALFAFDGQRMVGYLGWAIYDEEDARAFAQTGRPPPPERADGSDVVWLLTVATVAPETLKAMLQVGRRLHAGRRVMGVRHKRSGKMVVFDQPIRAPRP